MASEDDTDTPDSATHDPYELPTLYDLEYAECTEDVDHYRNLVQQTTGPVLELAAGTGRLTLAIVPNNRSMLAVDRSAKMLQVLDRRLTSKQRHKIRTRIGDMREPQAKDEFGLVILAFNSLQHLATLSDVAAMFQASRVSAKPGGLMGIDAYLPRDDIWTLDGQQDEIIRIDPQGGRVWRNIQTTTIENSRTLVTSTMWTSQRGLIQHTTTLTQHLYPRDELVEIARAAGWHLQRSYRDFEGTPSRADDVKWVAVFRAV